MLTFGNTRGWRLAVGGLAVSNAQDYRTVDLIKKNSFRGCDDRHRIVNDSAVDADYVTLS